MISSNQDGNEVSFDDLSSVLNDKSNKVESLIPLFNEGVLDIKKAEPTEKPSSHLPQSANGANQPIINRTFPSKNNKEFDTLLSKNTEGLKKTNSTVSHLNCRISQLMHDNNDLKKQISTLILSSNQHTRALDNQERIGSFQKRRPSAQKNIKPPFLAYTGLALASVIIVTLASYSYSTQSDVDGLSKQMTMLNKKKNGLTNNYSTDDIEKLKRQVNFLTSAGHQISTQFNEINSALKENPLTPVINGLVKTNNLTQQAIKQLSKKVSSLEIQQHTIPSPAVSVDASSWIINLVSFKQESFAVSQAEVFNSKGVSTSVVPVKINGEDWFRLRASGFKSKEEAVLSITDIKEKLNLSNVWVAELK